MARHITAEAGAASEGIEGRSPFVALLKEPIVPDAHGA
jgi:hypothetical protein